MSLLQIQPNFAGLTEFNQFSDSPHNCLGFMTIPILMGLFISIILLGILSIGFSCLFTIETYDRFEEPEPEKR